MTAEVPRVSTRVRVNMRVGISVSVSDWPHRQLSEMVIAVPRISTRVRVTISGPPSSMYRGTPHVTLRYALTWPPLLDVQGDTSGLKPYLCFCLDSYLYSYFDFP